MKVFQIKMNKLPFSVSLVLIGLLVFSFTAAIIIAANLSNTVHAQSETFTGEWIADFNGKGDDKDKAYFRIIRRTERGGQDNSGNDISLKDLQGLTREQVFSARSDVNFRIVREAGTFQCEGFFKEGKGAGVWTLTINQNFVSAMRSRGYDNLTQENLFTAALVDVQVKIIDDLKSAGYNQLSFNNVVEASIFKVNSEFISDLKSAGFENLSFKQLVEARIFKVDSKFAKEVETMGFGKQPLKKLVEMKIHKITDRKSVV